MLQHYRIILSTEKLLSWIAYKRKAFQSHGFVTVVPFISAADLMVRAVIAEA